LLNDVEDFHMVAVRSIHGLDFPLAKQTIHAVFLLLGNRGNPTQHLRFLAEIARRAENPHFIDDWIAADSVDDLAELLLSTEEE
jgi:mannitol/fructose-specific phosphotransferase system IIA component (Ntr-type)